MDEQPIPPIPTSQPVPSSNADEAAMDQRRSQQGMATMQMEMFLCERYRPLSGWSSNHLLPTDQHAYRIRGKKGGFNNIGEAEEAILSPGWVWENSRWAVDSGGKPADSEGWSYAMNFNSSFDGYGKSGLNIFTRWQRLVRAQGFGGVEQLGHYTKSEPYTLCPNFELEYGEQVGRTMQEAIAAASLGADFSVPVLVNLKRQLLDRLATSKNTTLDGVLNDFIGAQKNRFTSFFKGTDDAAVMARVTEIGANFVKAEREAYAVLAVRRFSPDQACSKGKEEKHECPFAIVHCENEGCSDALSAHSLSAHDSVCLFKVISCDKCSEDVRRAELQRHLIAACSMRDASCSFSSIGCNRALTHRDVGAHLDECTQAHMLLLLQTVRDQQAVISELTARVVELEGNRAVTAKVLASLDANAIATGTAQQTFNDSVNKALKDAAAAPEKKANAAAAEAKKHADSAVSGLRSELSGHRSELNTLKTSVFTLNAKVEPMIRVMTK